jgi:hypothetical protein
MSVTYAKGKYLVEILDQGYEESSTKRTPGFFLQVRVTGRYGPKGDLEECPQLERTYRQYLANDVGVNILRGILKAIDVCVTDLTQLDPEAPNHVSLVGRLIDMICDHESYQGKTRERWDIPRSRKKLDLNGVLALNNKFGHLLKDGNGQAKPSPAVTKPNDSNVPF